MLAEDFEHVREQRDSGAEENEADEVERMGVWLAEVGKVDVDEDEASDADGDVEEEDISPVKVVNDEAPHHRAEHGRDESGNGDEAHGAEQVGFAEGTDESEAADGNHHGSAAALQNAAEDEDVDVGREAAKE